MKNKKILSLSLLLSIALPAIAFAQSITGLVANLASVITKVAVFVTVVSWIITGLLFLIAQGDPGKVGKARSALIWAVVGTAVALLAGTASTIIGNALLTGN